MKEKILHYMQQYHMTQPGDRVILGVSGGADSVCLLLVLSECAEDLGIALSVVHVHHGLRKEADEEETYVRALCAARSIPFLPVHADVRGLALQQKLSCEEAGRLARYQAFAAAAAAYQDRQVKIAVAHHRNDCAETVLFHLFRGSGMAGLAGIRPVRENIIRPLLCVSREEIEQYLYKNGISYCMDASNEGDAYTRNRIRHHIIPYAEQQICQGSVLHITQAAEVIAETEGYLEELTEQACQRCLIEMQETGKGIALNIVTLMSEHAVMQKRILHAMVKQASGSAKDISAVHIEKLMGLLTAQGSRQLSLPHGLVVRKEYDRLLFLTGIRQELTGRQDQMALYPVTIPGRIELPDGKVLEFQRFPHEKTQIIPQKAYTKWFDYDKIEKSLIVRRRCTGDFLTIDSYLSHQTLKKYMIQEKIPKEHRDCIYVLADGAHILWVIGHRISQYYKVDENTKNILQVQCTPL